MTAQGAYRIARGSAVYEAIAAENLPGMEVVEAHQTELKLRVQDPSAKLGAIFAAVEKLRTAPAPPDARTSGGGARGARGARAARVGPRRDGIAGRSAGSPAAVLSSALPQLQ